MATRYCLWTNGLTGVVSGVVGHVPLISYSESGLTLRPGSSATDKTFSVKLPLVEPQLVASGKTPNIVRMMATVAGRAMRITGMSLWEGSSVKTLGTGWSYTEASTPHLIVGIPNPSLRYTKTLEFFLSFDWETTADQKYRNVKIFNVGLELEDAP